MLSPQPQPSAQMPNFQAGGASPAPAPQAAPQGKPEKPVTHGLVTGEDIDERIATLPRSAQQSFIQAVSTIPNLPDIFGIAIGPEAHDYIAQVAQAVEQQKAGGNAPQNSPVPSQSNPGGLTNAALPTSASSPTTSATFAGPQGQ